ncbi:Cadmium-induced protein AS8, partial [Mucuna pruriens]
MVVPMIIKGLFRRYERWNPVHPTYGAFWGMGVGVGCGVGWGPGFGPEVIGYVGAGCGIGFNVGITFAGIGVGLPANYIFEAPYNGVSWIRHLPCVSDLQREANEKLFGFRQKHLSIKGIDFFDMNKSLPLVTSACKSIQAFHDQLFCSHKERRSLTLYEEGDSCQKEKIDDFHNCQFCAYFFLLKMRLNILETEFKNLQDDILVA